MILGNGLEDACTCAAEFLGSTLKMPSVDAYLECIEVIEMLQTANISKVQPVVKQKVLVYSVYIGVFKALWFGFFEILSVMCETLVSIGTELDSDFPEFTKTLMSQIEKYGETKTAESFFAVPIKFANAKI